MREKWNSPEIFSDAYGFIDVPEHKRLTINDACILMRLLDSAIQNAQRMFEKHTDEELAVIGQKWDRPLSFKPCRNGA